MQTNYFQTLPEPGEHSNNVGMASNNMRPLQFLGSLYVNNTHKIHTLGPPHIAQHHA